MSDLKSVLRYYLSVNDVWTGTNHDALKRAQALLEMLTYGKISKLEIFIIIIVVLL